MNPSGGIGDLTITIGGDLSELEAAFAQIPQMAEEVFGQLETVVQSVDFADMATGADAAAASVANVSDAVTTTTDDLTSMNDAITASADETQSSAEALSSSLEGVSESASEAASGANELAPALEDASEGAESASEGVGSLMAQLVEFGEALAVTEALKEFGEEALETYGNVQQVTTSLTALTGSATEANEVIEQLKDLAMSDALSFPTLTAAAQKMVALGVSTDDLQGALQAAADSAAATGNAFASVTNSMDRMVLSGTANARSLTLLGISLQDLNTAMGDAGAGADASATEISAAFKALDPSDRLDAIETALGKFQGVAGQVAQGISGQWQNFKTQWEFVMESIGEAIAPVISALLEFASTTIIPVIQAMVNWFNELPAPIKDAAVAVGLLVAAIGPALVAIGGFSLAMTGVQVALGEAVAEEGIFAAAFSGIAEVAAGVATAIESVGVAISTGMVGALTSGEAMLLKFAAAGAAVAAAFTFYDQIKQLASNLTDLGSVLSAGVPLWNDLKEAMSSVADMVSGAVSTAFTALMGLLGPVGAAIQSIGAYLPSFSSLWQDVGNAISSIHWSDLIGPIGALNSALKALADAIQLVTGNYPSMAVAGTNALNSLESANDKLNDSLATQAGAFTAIAPVQAAYTAAHQASTAAVDAHTAAANAATPAIQSLGAAHTATAAAATQHASATKDATAAVTGMIGPVMQGNDELAIYAASHKNAAVAAAELSTGIVVLSGSMKDEAAVAASLGIAIDNGTGEVNTFNDATGKAYASVMNTYGAMVHWSNSMQEWVTNGATPAVAAVQQITSSVETLGQELDAAANSAENFGSKMKSAASSAASAMGAAASSVQDLNQELDKTMDAGNIGNLSVSLQPGQTYSEPTGVLTGGTFGGTLGQSNFESATGGFNPIPFGDQTNVFDQQLSPMVASLEASIQQMIAGNISAQEGLTSTGTAATAASTALNSAATGVTSSTTALNTALEEATAANKLEALAAAGQGTSAYSGLKAVADAAVQTAANALSAAENLGTLSTAAATASTTTTTVTDTMVPLWNQANTSVAGFSQQMLNAGNALVPLQNSATQASTALTSVGTAAEGLDAALAPATQQVQALSGSMAGLSEAVSAASEGLGKLPSITDVGNTASTSLYEQAIAGMATTSGFTGTANWYSVPTNANTPVITDTAGQTAGGPSTTPVMPSLNVVINNPGIVVGAGGMQQLSNMVSNNLVQQLGQMGIRLNRQ